MIDQLQRKSKLLFTSFRELHGSVRGAEFDISQSKRSSWFAHRIIGQILSESQTVIKLTFSFPLLIVILFCIMPAIVIIQAVSAIWMSDVATINGVLREPALSERIMFSLFIIIVPAVLVGAILFYPLILLRKRLKNELRLTEIKC